MSLLNLNEILSSVNGKFVGNKNNMSKFGFSSVTTDSRGVCKGSLFVPLIGQVQDGHKYIPSAIEKGASVIFVAEKEYNSDSEKYNSISEKNENVSFIVVRDTLKALQDAAAAYVEKFPSLIKVGITGSSGKTTTKEMVVSVLKQKYNVVYTQGNFNSETGLPLSVFNIRPEHEVGVFELGMNRRDEIGEIAAVLKPKYALITNIGTAHIGILGSRKNIAVEKRKIFKYLPQDGVAFIPAEDDFSEFLGENVRSSVAYYGDSVPEQESGARYLSDLGLDGTEFSLDGIKIHLKNPGIYNYRNALGACAVGKTLGLSAGQIKKGLENVDSVNGRMETLSLKLKNGADITLIKDCYNANPESMCNVLDFCSSLKNAGGKIYVLGDMLELGEKSCSEHERIALKAEESSPKLVLLVGGEMRHGFEAIQKKGFNNAEYIAAYDNDAIAAAGKKILMAAGDGDVVLVKASRGIALERIVSVIDGEEK